MLNISMHGLPVCMDGLPVGDVERVGLLTRTKAVLGRGALHGAERGSCDQKRFFTFISSSTWQSRRSEDTTFMFVLSIFIHSFINYGTACFKHKCIYLKKKHFSKLFRKKMR